MSDEYKDMDCDDWDYMALKKLVRYEDLEESGKLFITPYKLNDVVYIIGDNDEIEKTFVDGFEIRRFRDGFEFFILIPIYDDVRQTGYQAMSQESVFLTREDAEEKLKEME